MNRSKKFVLFNLIAVIIMSTFLLNSDICVVNADDDIGGQIFCSNSEELNSLISELASSEDLAIDKNTVLQLSDGIIYKYNNITVSEGATLTVSGTGTLCASVIKGGRIVLKGGTVYAGTIQGQYEQSEYYSGVNISGGNITANTIFAGYGTSENPQGADLVISGGKVTVYKELLGGDSYYSKICNGGNVNINGGEVTVYGLVQAGSGSGNSSSYQGGVGGNVVISSKAKVYVEGTIQGGTGANRGIYSDEDSSRGGNVSISSGTTVVGTVAGGTGGNGYKWEVHNGGHGGNVYIYGGNITGKISGGQGGDGYDSHSGADIIYGGKSGSIYFYGGNINAVDGIYVDCFGKASYHGDYGRMYSSENSDVYITGSVMPAREKSCFLSGIVNIDGNIEVYGNKTFEKDVLIDDTHTLTIEPNASLTISGCSLSVDGQIINNGALTVSEDAALNGNGTYTFKSTSESYNISEMIPILKTDNIIIPENIIYDGTDQLKNITVKNIDTSYSGVTLKNCSFETRYNKLVYCGTAISDSAVNAGYYTVVFTDDNSNIAARQSFTVNKRLLEIEKITMTEDRSVSDVYFANSAVGDDLANNIDYSFKVTSVDESAQNVSGTLVLKFTEKAENYSVNTNGTYENIPYDIHTHDYQKRSDASHHWSECSCGSILGYEEHICDDGEITTQPTTESEGVKTFRCTVCGMTLKTESIPVLPSITYVSGDVKTVEGLSASFSINANGTELSYCWKKLVNGSFEETGCTSSSFIIDRASENSTYICVVTDKYERTAASPEFKLIIVPAEEVSEETVNSMSIDDCIKLVNYFNSIHDDDDSMILPNGIAAAVKRVLEYDLAQNS